jgi:hypothetical protein
MAVLIVVQVLWLWPGVPQPPGPAIGTAAPPPAVLAPGWDYGTPAADPPPARPPARPQNIFSLLRAATVLGIVFNRLARGSPRAASIIFSDKAVMRQLEPGGPYHLMFQVRARRGAGGPLHAQGQPGGTHLAAWRHPPPPARPPQVCDMKRHALVEAHVRAYCVRRGGLVPPPAARST